ncbi:MAG: Ldh family oxidoreductase [Rhodocyclaceae bacterium]
MSEQDLRIPYDRLCERLSETLQAHGVPADIAALEARVMAEADLHETPSHGVRMLPNLLKAFAEGRAQPNPPLSWPRDLGAMCVLDGHNGPGRYVAITAMQAAIDRAKRFGIGACVAIHTTHWGRAHAYALHAARAGVIGLCSTNAVNSMAAWGSAAPVIGNNPIAIGIPRANADAVVLDIAMSQAAVGKVTTWLREGRELPAGWGVDATGKPTTDPKAILAGAVSPMGGHKGAGLALMMEFMTAALGGGLFGHELDGGRTSLECETSKIFIALDVAAFGPADAFDARVSAYLDYLGAHAGVPEPFYAPGGRGWQAAHRNLEAGVPLHPEIVEQLKAAGVRLD